MGGDYVVKAAVGLKPKVQGAGGGEFQRPTADDLFDRRIGVPPMTGLYFLLSREH